VDARSEPAKAVVPEPRQRWRLVVARAADAPRLAQRELTAAWEAAIDASGLPAARLPGSVARPRVAFGAPLPVAIEAEAELIDMFLVERRTRWQVREALGPVVPVGWSLVELEDVWLGGPSLGGIVVAADYRITLDGTVDEAAVAGACRALLEATSLPRERDKGGATVTYDLRPLLAGLEVADPGPPVVVRARTRFHQALGTGRPDEVVSALAERLDRPLAGAAIVRERLILVDASG
jgi:radical SAM-linked protein